MKKIRIVSIMMIVLFAASFSSCKTEVKTKAIDKADMDLTVDPATDFDQYANGGWKANNPLPADKSRFGSFDKLRDTAETQLQSLFNKVTSKQHEKGSIDQKIADFYNVGMDSATIEKQGVEPLQPYLDKIAASETIDDIEQLIIDGHFMGYGTLFGFYGAPDRRNSDLVIANISQGGLGLSDRDYYLSQDDRSKEIREEYVKHIARMFKLAGDTESVANEKANKVMALETRLAEASLTRLERRDPVKTYNKMDISTLVELSPEFRWETFFTSMGLPDQQEINVGMPNFLVEVSNMMTDVPVDDWKAYLSWGTINDAASFLSSDFVNADFDFYGKVMKGQEQNRDRWKRIQGSTNWALSEAIGQLYVAEYFPPEAKSRMVNLVENLRVALGQRIDKLEWMSDGTKEKAHEKLAKINVKIGYPDKWRDYSDLEIGQQSFLDNVMRSRAFNAAYNRSKINQPVDKTEWHMSPQTVNAYYSPSMNEVVFPAAILQPPFFYLNADDAVNYGAIGVVIGHEITHGFDDQGRKYDKDGNLNDWWTVEDGQRFDKRAAVLANEYDQFVVLDSVHANGQLTMGENIADLGGLNISLQAFHNGSDQKQPIDGFTPDQRFFLAYAHLWASNVRDKELLRLTKEDVHSLGRFRVLGPLRNMPEFYAAFDVKEGDYMYLPENERAIIW